MADKLVCTQCGTILPSGILDDRCPQCLLLSALEESPEETRATTGSSPQSGVKIFGDFELLEEIARGGMGTVYKARQISLNRMVAVKMILAGGLASPNAIRRFQAEAENVARLQHPNIVAIHEVGEFEGHHYFAMDYVEGPSLATLVRENSLPAQRAVEYLKTIAEAVHYAHQQGVLHRDLKPSNVLIDPLDQPRITDFGLAKRLSSDSDLTLPGQTVGSPNFMPPEQAEGRQKEVGPASDVYALGALLYHLLTGRPPFQAETLTSLLKQVVESEPVPPRLLNPTVPRDLETICLKCLEKVPEKRYLTAQALAEDLGRFLNGEAVLARPIGSVGKVSRWCQRKPLIASLMAGLVIVFASGLLGILWQWRRAEHQRINAQSNELLALQNAYAADMNLAQRALQENDLGRALELMNRYRPPLPSPGDPRSATIDLRGWEWRYLWNLCRSDEAFTLFQSSNMVGMLALSPDGKWLAARHGKQLSLWDLAARREVVVWPCEGHRRALAFTPDGKYLAAGILETNSQPGVKLWEVSTRREASFLAHTGPVLFLAFSPDSRLATYQDTAARWQGLIQVWDLENRQIIATNHASPLPYFMRRGYGLDDGRGTLAFSPDGKILAIGEAGDTSGQIILWEWALGRQRIVDIPQANEGVTALSFSPDGTLLAAGYGYTDSNVHLWEVGALTNRIKLEGHKSWISALVFGNKGKLLVSASGDQTLRLWDVPQRSVIRSLRGHTHEVWSAAVSADDKQLFSGGKDGFIRVWDLDVAPVKSSPMILPGQISFAGTAFAPDNQTLFTVMGFKAEPGIARTVRAWDLVTGLEKRQFPALGTNNYSVAVSPDNRLLAVGGGRSTVKIWDLVNDHSLTNLTTQMEINLGLAFDRQGRRLLVGGWSIDSASFTQWEVSSWRRLSSNMSVLGTVVSKEISPDFHQIALGHANGGVSVWDVATGKKWCEFQGNLPTAVRGVVFLFDGTVLAAGGEDGFIRLYDIVQRRELETLRGQMSAVHSLAVSPDGRRLASGGTRPNEAVRLWDVATRKDLLNLEGQGNEFRFTSFSPDGNLLVAINSKYQLHLWRAPSWAEIEAAENK